MKLRTVPIICGLCGGTASDLADDIPFRMQVVAPPTDRHAHPHSHAALRQHLLIFPERLFTQNRDLTGLSIQCSLCQVGPLLGDLQLGRGENTNLDCENQPAGDDAESLH